MQVVGVFVNCGIEQQVFTDCVLLKIPVMDDYFPGVGFIQAVYFRAFFPGKNQGKFQGGVFYGKEFFFYRILVYKISPYITLVFSIRSFA